MEAPRTVVDFDHLFLKTQVSLSLEVLDDASTTFQSEHVYCIKAKGRCRFLSRSFTWTGGGNIDQPEVLCGHDQWGHSLHKVHGPILKEGKHSNVLIDLGKYLEEGEEEIVHLKYRLWNLNGTFEPFLSFSIREGGVEHVSLALILPDGMQKKVTYGEGDLQTGHVGFTTPLLPEVQENKTLKYRKNWNLLGTEINRVLRIDWTRVQ
jgi:hypothetical protein